MLSLENVFGCGKYKTAGRKSLTEQIRMARGFITVATPSSPVLHRNLILGEIFMFLALYSLTEMLMKSIFSAA